MRAINQIEAVHLLQIIQGATVKPAVFDPRAQAPLPQQLGVLQAHCAHRLVLAQQLRHLMSALFRHFKVGRVHLDLIRRGILVPRPAFWTAQAPASRPPLAALAASGFRDVPPCHEHGLLGAARDLAPARG